MPTRTWIVVPLVALLSAALPSQQVLPVAHWSFDDPAGAGVIESVQAITETLVGPDVRVPGQFGTALQCVNTYFDSIVDQSSWNYLDSFTVTCWLRAGAGQTAFVPVIDQHSWQMNMGTFVGLGSGNGSHIAVGNGTAWQSLYGPNLVAGTWTHCAFVFDSTAVNGELVCYLDGVAVQTTNIPGGPMNDPRGVITMRVGARGGGGGGYFLNADLDDLAIFDFALTATDVMDVMTFGALPPPEYQTNSALASLDVNGIQGTSQVFADVTVPVGGSGSLGFSSTSVGQPWDVVIGSDPLVPASAGGVTTSNGQIINIDLTDPSLVSFFNLLQGPPFGPTPSFSIPFSLSVSTALSAQMVIMNASAASGASLSQPIRLNVQ